MSRIRYVDLSEEDKGFIINGCGAKGGPFNPPDFIFTASCDQHDFNYWLGCTEADRLEADFQFYQAMIVDAYEASWYSRYFYCFLAWIYYKAVRVFGKKFFYYGSKKRTRKDLEEIKNSLVG